MATPSTFLDRSAKALEGAVGQLPHTHTVRSSPPVAMTGVDLWTVSGGTPKLGRKQELLGVPQAPGRAAQGSLAVSA
jgi:hypothetical protein